MYEIQILRGDWRMIKTSWCGDWAVTEPFEEVEEAIEGLDEWLDAHSHMCGEQYRIVNDDTGEVVATRSHRNGDWDFNPADERSITIMGTINLPINLEKPLNLDRVQVIAKLTDNLTKEQQARQAAEQKETDARNDFRQFVSDNEEQIVNYLRSHMVGSTGTWKNTLERFEDTFKDDAFKNPDSKPGRLESELEKFVRVLEMTADATIEVTPTQEVYDLL